MKYIKLIALWLFVLAIALTLKIEMPDDSSTTFLIRVILLIPFSYGAILLSKKILYK